MNRNPDILTLDLTRKRLEEERAVCLTPKQRAAPPDAPPYDANHLTASFRGGR